MESKTQKSLIPTNTKNIAYSYGCKLVYVNDKFSKPFKIHLGEEGVYNFINNMIKESKYCSDVMKKHFTKEFVMTKEDNEDFKNSTKCWICDNDHVDNDVKVRDLVILLEYIQALLIEIIISILN